MKYLGSMNMAEWTIAFSIVYTFIAVGGKKKV